MMVLLGAGHRYRTYSVNYGMSLVAFHVKMPRVCSCLLLWLSFVDISVLPQLGLC